MTGTTMDETRTAEQTEQTARGYMRIRPQQPEHTVTPLFYALCEAEENEDDRLKRLIAAAQRLSGELARVAASLTANPTAVINDLGVVQGSGPEIDRLCGELEQARKAARTLRKILDAGAQATP